jgi:cell division protein FtsB
MNREQKQSGFRRFFTSKLFSVVALVVLILVALGYVRAFHQNYNIKQEIRQLESEVRKLETKKLESMVILKYVTSKDFVEEKARTELSMKKPGEKVAVIERDKIGTEVDKMKNESEEHLDNPSKWWYYFRHKRIK